MANTHAITYAHAQERTHAKTSAQTQTNTRTHLEHLGKLEVEEQGALDLVHKVEEGEEEEEDEQKVAQEPVQQAAEGRPEGGRVVKGAHITADGRN